MMNKVLTKSEYEELKHKKTPVSRMEDVKKNNNPDTNREVYNTEFYLMHPDASENSKVNGVFVTDVKGVVKDLKIIDNIIKTKSEDIKNYLVQKGFIYLYSKEIEVKNE